MVRHPLENDAGFKGDIRIHLVFRAWFLEARLALTVG